MQALLVEDIEMSLVKEGIKDNNESTFILKAGHICRSDVLPVEYSEL